MHMPFLRRIAQCLVVAMLIVGIVPKMEAGLVPSEITDQKGNRAQDLDKIQKVIEAKMVGERLAKLGFTVDEVKSRLERLNDQQLHQLALNLDNMKVAGDDGLGLVIALLVIAILVVLFLQLTGHQVIVK